jgi:hypothetical protein
MGGLTTRGGGGTATLYSGHGRTTRERGLTTSSGNPGGMQGAGRGAGMGTTPRASSCKKYLNH